MTVTVTLQVPPSVYRLAEQTAKATDRNVEDVLTSVLTAATPVVGDLPPEISTEVERLAELDDNALWRVARSSFPRDKRQRYDALLDKNGAGTIAPAERDELRQLRLESERLMVRKAHAYALLKWRGHVMPPLSELPRPR